MRHVLYAGLMALLLTPAAMDVCAQTAGTTTTIGVSVVELNDVINGWSVQHQLLGVCVYNDKDEKIGKIEDIILNKERIRLLQHREYGRFSRHWCTRRCHTGQTVRVKKCSTGVARCNKGNPTRHATF